MPRRAWIPLFCGLFVCLTLTPSVAHAKSKRRANNELQLKIQKLLEDKEKEVQACALKHLHKVDRPSVDITAFISIDSRGQMDAHVNNTLQPPAKEKLRDCVEAILQAVRWPKLDNTFVPINKTWSYSVR